MPARAAAGGRHAIVRGARLYATAGQRLPGDALAIRDGTIVAIGSWAGLRDDVGPETTVIDLGGRTVTPAFIDAHTHFHRGAVVRRFYLDFESLAPPDVATVLAHVADRAETTPDGDWIQGDSLSPSRLREGRLPDRHELDRAAGHHPVVLRGIGKHVVAANSAALAAAGIDTTTVDPPGGRIERDASGEPTGILHETAKLRLDQSHVETVVPTPSPDARRDALAASYGDLHRAGIATIHEMIRLPEEADDHAALRADGRLSVRVRLFYRVHESPLSLDWLERLGIRRGLGDDWLRVQGVKISVDGFCIFRNAAVEEPYRGEPDNRGLLRIDEPTLDDLVARANRQGLQIAVHAVGPRAVDLALDAFERAGPPIAGPHRLEHAYLDPDPARFARVRDLGLVWSTQPAFLGAYRREWAGAFEPARVDRIMPLRAGVDAGLTVLLDSDFPCAPFDPLDAIRLATDRRGHDGETAHPERLTVTEAWRAYTTTAADVAGDDRLGRIAVGARADLIALDEDPFDPATDMARLAVRATIVDGTLVAGQDEVGG